MSRLPAVLWAWWPCAMALAPSAVALVTLLTRWGFADVG